MEEAAFSRLIFEKLGVERDGHYTRLSFKRRRDKTYVGVYICTHICKCVCMHIVGSAVPSRPAQRPETAAAAVAVSHTIKRAVRHEPAACMKKTATIHSPS